ncbi:hypothetical protein NK718_03590 [Alsobacter sp. SYSU M60028]|uniref:Uncharacterized protein n=1 Tax=Alsobacter ponti TaxID=2962936 RepID=A0ABT1L916_9HYPH|nr:hypothetical protein [Alsobacter ponti]MCP8937586.1 hypothetical protein [Alsobacter ponti]
MVAVLAKGFLLPGNFLADLLGVESADDRGMTRTLVNMLFWNLVGAFVALWLA